MSSEKCTGLRSVIGFINKTFERIKKQQTTRIDIIPADILFFIINEL